MKRLFMAGLAALVALPSQAAAQSSAPPPATQAVVEDEVKNVKRHLVTFYKMGPGGRSAVKDIIWGAFLPAMREAGTPLPTILHPDDGEWDMVIIMPLTGGYTDLHFNTSPGEAKWQSIMLKKLGQKAFDEMFERWGKSWVHKESFIAHEH